MATNYSKNLSKDMNAAPYKESSAVKEANAQLEAVKAGKPADYDSSFSDQLGNLYNQIVNQTPYSFDLGTNELYGQYKEAYQQQGKKAALDTLSNTNAMNGGYGSTWSQVASNQQYGEYLKGLNDALPSLENASYNQYNSEQERLNDLYETTLNAENTDYQRYRDTVADWKGDREFAQNYAQQTYSNDYQQYSDKLGAAQTMIGWNREDAKADQSDAYQWAIKLLQQGILPNNTILKTAGINRDHAINLAKKYGYGDKGGSGSSKKKKKSGPGTNNKIDPNNAQRPLSK